MTDKLIFLWIDDDPQREKFCKNLNQISGVEANFINVSNKNVSQEIIKIVSNERPDLILIDHRLDRVSGEKILAGSTP